MFLGKVLVILSSAHQLELSGDKLWPTGFFLNEFGIPAQYLTNRGYGLVLANPQGNRPAIDATSDDPSYFGGDKERHQQVKAFVENLDGFQRPRKFADLLSEGLDAYDGIFVPGGHAPMQDLAQDPHLGRILLHFHQNQKPTAMICHGPVATLAAQDDPQGFLTNARAGRALPPRNWIYDGYEMTVFSNIEERLAEHKIGGKLKFHAETALKNAGAKLSVAWIPGSSKVVEDRELITAQNPASDGEFAKLFLQRLVERALVPSYGA